jgi:phosphate uptake regulator
MNRKLIRLAEKTLVVSVPSAWAKEHGLDKGDEVSCMVDNEKLIIVPPTKSAALASITISVEGLSERLLRWQISSLHKQGFDEIIITSFSEEQYGIIEDLVQHLFIGFIVKDKSRLRIIVGQVAVVDASEFDSTLRRSFRLVQTMFEETINAFNQGDSLLLKKQIEQEQLTNKLTNFCERLLNKSLTQKEKGHFWYVVAWNLEKIADNFKYLATHLDKITANESLGAFISRVHELFAQYYELFYNFSIEDMSLLTQKKKSLEQEALDLLASADVTSRLVGHYMHMVILQIADFSASFIALRFSSDEK